MSNQYRPKARRDRGRIEVDAESMCARGGVPEEGFEPSHPKGTGT
jgi:hypothetical protein